jgi:hypothetical protein
MIDYTQLEGLSRVDICIGGDHGGGKFRMSFKVLFRFESNETISRLYQIASVSHPKDDSQMLNDTVLKPIGDSLKIIVDGGFFIVQRDNASNLLAVNYTLMVTILLLFYYILLLILLVLMTGIATVSTPFL